MGRFSAAAADGAATASRQRTSRITTFMTLLPRDRVRRVKKRDSRIGIIDGGGGVGRAERKAGGEGHEGGGGGVSAAGLPRPAGAPGKGGGGGGLVGKGRGPEKGAARRRLGKEGGADRGGGFPPPLP